MNHYELTYIVPMSFSVDEMPAIAKNVNKLLEDAGAKIAKETTLGKIKFAYPINKQSHGYYNVVEFDCEPLRLIEIEKTIIIANGVARHLIVTKRIKSEKELAAEQKLRAKIAEQDKNRKSIFDEEEGDEEQEHAPRPKRAKKERAKIESAPKVEKVDIADLDKKLDAILDGGDMVQ
jgi:small subunit ribosomal protein S6